MKKINSILIPLIIVLIILITWYMISEFGNVPAYMLPSPIDVGRAFIVNFDVISGHMKTTLYEATLGLGFGIVLGFVTAVLMDMSKIFYKASYPLIVFTQTIPTIAIAPALILWLGYETTPKIVLVIISTFFPITINLLQAFKSTDQDSINLLKAMGAGKMMIFRHIKLPGCVDSFFVGLKIAVTYSIIGAVIAEWLGGTSGLGVYINRVRKSYKFDEMFAAIILISVLSIVLMMVTNILHKAFTPYKNKSKQ